jgi:RIO kinase 1
VKLKKITTSYLVTMGTKMGKSKSRARKYQLKERAKIDSGIFDEKTMINLGRFFNRGVIEKLEFNIARGKEADLYIATAGNSDMVEGEQFVILKFFRIETSSFFKMDDYIIGDPRFERIKMTSKYEIVKVWCRKEMGNLEIAARAGVHAPRPIMSNGSILAMSLIGTDSVPSPQLKDAELEEPEKLLDVILGDMKKLYKENLVHGDLSEYNILIKDQVPYMIDFGQAVVLTHPRATEFLHRDISNILDYFAKTYHISRDRNRTLAWITGKSQTY